MTWIDNLWTTAFFAVYSRLIVKHKSRIDDMDDVIGECELSIAFLLGMYHTRLFKKCDLFWIDNSYRQPRIVIAVRQRIANKP